MARSLPSDNRLMSAYGSIIIDAGLAGQKVQAGRDTGGNTEKVANEEYGALVLAQKLRFAATAHQHPSVVRQTD